QVETSSRRFLEHGVFRQLILDIRLLLAYHLFRISPADLAARYRVTARDQTLDPDRRGVMVGVMAKAPLPGHAKTRLGKDLGKEQALAIYGLILKNTLNKLEKLPVGFHPLLLAAGKRDQAWFQEHYPGWQIKRQVGGTLGDRLQKASEQMFLSDAQKVILVAADVPDVGVSEVLDAARGLDEAHLILGPSPDGGYYLIGIDQPYPELFQDIHWGSERVLEQTRAKAQFLGLKIQMLSPLMDIDTGRDWKMHQNENLGEG
ncbi:MAG: TIGR04282 family arsenosugar biosynthesis glycosyltransferase, partial [Anaerolineales bacterium]|nr:TIGR04282 family arsenosugar biosynthesis glycosyltransferase [Anaerolineales bacterium]